MRVLSLLFGLPSGTLTHLHPRPLQFQHSGCVWQDTSFADCAWYPRPGYPWPSGSQIQPWESENFSSHWSGESLWQIPAWQIEEESWIPSRCRNLIARESSFPDQNPGAMSDSVAPPMLDLSTAWSSDPDSVGQLHSSKSLENWQADFLLWHSVGSGELSPYPEVYFAWCEAWKFYPKKYSLVTHPEFSPGLSGSTVVPECYQVSHLCYSDWMPIHLPVTPWDLQNDSVSSSNTAISTYQSYPSVCFYSQVDFSCCHHLCETSVSHAKCPLLKEKVLPSWAFQHPCFLPGCFMVLTFCFLCCPPLSWLEFGCVAHLKIPFDFVSPNEQLRKQDFWVTIKKKKIPFFEGYQRTQVLLFQLMITPSTTFAWNQSIMEVGESTLAYFFGV